MKKTLIIGIALLLTACACNSERCQLKNKTEGQAVAEAYAPKTEEAVVEAAKTGVEPVMYEGNIEAIETVPVTTEVVAPVAVSSEIVGSCSCKDECKCRTQEPIVLKPRVTEVVGAERKRPCCDDGFWMQDENVETYVPDAPEIYVIAANRAFNSMQEEAAPLFKQVGKMKVYVGEAKPLSEDLPGGMNKGMEVIKKRLEQTENVKVVNNKFVADYRIDSSADWYDTPTKTVPAVKYNITFKDRGGNLVGEWSEIIHQAEGDRSWW